MTTGQAGWPSARAVIVSSQRLDQSEAVSARSTRSFILSPCQLQREGHFCLPAVRMRGSCNFMPCVNFYVVMLIYIYITPSSLNFLSCPCSRCNCKWLMSVAHFS
jgi:hypothetical protein